MKGILFTPEMAATACAGRKTQTRRVIVPQPAAVEYWMHGKPSTRTEGVSIVRLPDRPGRSAEEMNPYGRPGERRCLLTTWAVRKRWDTLKPLEVAELPRARIWHAGMGTPKPYWAGKLRPGRFLPNQLRPLMPMFDVVSVRAERLQDITEEDAKAESVRINRFEVWHWRDDSAIGGLDARDAYRLLWDSINAPRGFGWSVNPWVWVVTFRLVSSPPSALRPQL